MYLNMKKQNQKQPHDQPDGLHCIRKWWQQPEAQGTTGVFHSSGHVPCNTSHVQLGKESQTAQSVRQSRDPVWIPQTEELPPPARLRSFCPNVLCQLPRRKVWATPEEAAMGKRAARQSFFPKPNGNRVQLNLEDELCKLKVQIEQLSLSTWSGGCFNSYTLCSFICMLPWLFSS